MSNKRYSVEQIVAKLREAEKLQAQGLTISQVCKRLGISDQAALAAGGPPGAAAAVDRLREAGTRDGGAGDLEPAGDGSESRLVVRLMGGRTRDGGPIRILNVVDEYTRLAVGCRVARSIGAGDIRSARAALRALRSPAAAALR